MNKPTKSQRLRTQQGFFPGFSPVDDALAELSEAGAEARGAIFTRKEVVEFILDLVGYTSDKPLYQQSLLEPSFGDGDFLLVAVERLLNAWKNAGQPCSEEELGGCIQAVELHEGSCRTTTEKVLSLLAASGVSSAAAKKLARGWITHEDFLLAEIPENFDYIVGNPPYVRQELIPNALIAEYRARYSTIYDRADIYVPFIERSLSLLSEIGKLGFICADRWMKNRYGRRLRELVSGSFHLHTYVDMYDTPAFHSDVIAYPAIFIIGADTPGPTRVAHRPEITRSVLSKLAEELTQAERPNAASEIKEIANIADGGQPWILESSDQLGLVRRLERDFPTIEETGCKVGIGVATGADKAFIGPFDELDVEDDRKLPIVMTRDILTGEVQWRGFGIVNPFADEGGLIDLKKYPRTKRFLEERKDQIAKRHVAQKAPTNWYRTIDRIYPALANEPKLLIPDIKGDAHVVYEGGKLYPHHNLYFITSKNWDLRALQAVLMSGIAKLFVATYSTKMRGGYLRFQAQYLRKIRLPHWSHVSEELMSALVDAAKRGDVEACNSAVFELYGLNEDERTALGGNGETTKQTGDRMPIDLVDYEAKTREAVKAFWGNREAARQKQIESGKADQGERAGVTAGKNMDGFIALVTDIVRANGLERASIHLKRKVVTLPGYFRPTKLWDVVVMNEGRLVAALEFKSQVGPSFGNNFNNRTEEAIGTAHDIWTAFREGAFGEQSRPFVGWLILVEDADGSRKPIKDVSPHFPVFKEFRGASYLDRYNILCRKLVQEQLYSAAAVITSPRSSVDNGEYTELSELSGLKTFVTELAGHVAAESMR